MEVQVINISTAQELDLTMQSIVDNLSIYIDKDVVIDESIFQDIVIHLTGPKFDSSLTTSLMRTILQLQNQIYNYYAFTKYGDIKPLKKIDKNEVELNVKIEPGSSFINIETGELLKGIMASMTGFEIAGTIGIVTTAFLIFHMYKINSKEKTERLKIEAESKATIAHTEREKCLYEAFVSLIANHQKVESSTLRTLSNLRGPVEINGETFTAAELYDLGKIERKKKTTSSEIVKGNYLVQTIHFPDNGEISIDLKEEESSRIFNKVVLSEVALTSEDYKLIQDATDRESIYLELFIIKKNEEIISSAIMRVEHRQYELPMN